MATKSANRKQYPRFDPKNMKFRFLGSTGMKVSVFSLGGWLTYGSYDNDLKLTKECLKAAWDSGINFFDTAEAYADGNSERVMGEAIKQLGWKREEFVLSTKIFFGTGGPPPNNRGLSRKHVLEGFNASLDRLQLEYVDVVFCHRPDAGTPMEEVVRTFTDLVNSQKVFYWGTSEWSAFEIEHAMHIADNIGGVRPVVEQPQYNMLIRDRFESEYEPIYKLYGHGTTVWSPLCSGVLTGKYNEGIPKGSRLGRDKSKFLKSLIKGEEGNRNIERATKLAPIAKKLGCSMAQLALAWTLKNENVSTTILGASRPDQIYENVKALDYVDKLTPKIMNDIEKVLRNKPTIPLRR